MHTSETKNTVYELWKIKLALNKFPQRSVSSENEIKSSPPECTQRMAWMLLLIKGRTFAVKLDDETDFMLLKLTLSIGFRKGSYHFSLWRTKRLILLDLI